MVSINDNFSLNWFILQSITSIVNEIDEKSVSSCTAGTWIADEFCFGSAIFSTDEPTTPKQLLVIDLNLRHI